MSGQFLIQLTLLLATAGLVFYFLSNRQKARAKAGVKLGFVAFVFAAAWAVLRPDDLTVIAQHFGVSRGSDLLLYVLTVAFMFTTLSAWIRFREQDLRYARLARAVALSNSVAPTDDYPAPPAVVPATTGSSPSIPPQQHNPQSTTPTRDPATPNE